ncbi:MAG: Uma2 family endonuclease [Cyanobacteria bacterium J06560_6]
MVQTPLRTTTLEDFLLLPDTKPASELIDGRIIQKPMPKAAHSVIQGSLTTAINQALRSDKEACALPELRCAFDGVAIIPDITVLPWELIPRDESGMINGDLLSPPTWMIKILSPGQSQSKVVKKILHAIDSGTEIGWLIDPAEKCVFSYRPERIIELWEVSSGTLPTPAFASNFYLSVAELVGWLYA